MEPRHHKGAESTSPRHGLRHRVRITVPRLSRFAVELLLPLGAVIALVWVNTAPESYYAFTVRCRLRSTTLRWCSSCADDQRGRGGRGAWRCAPMVLLERLVRHGCR